MSQVSKYPVSNDAYVRIFDILAKTKTGICAQKLTANLLDESSAPVLRVGTDTISRVSYACYSGNNYRHVIKNTAVQENSKIIWMRYKSLPIF